MSAKPPRIADRPITVPDFAAAKSQGRKLAVVTAYDYAMARLCDQAGVDALLIGDSLGMVVHGNEHCLGVTLEDVIYHTRCVTKAARHALVVSDLPFMTFQVSPQQALENAGRVIQQGGAHAVKLEGGARSAAAIEAICRADIPVIAHVGLTPQSLRRFGGFKVQRDAERIRADAKAVQEAGAFAVVLECIPSSLAGEITRDIRIPTIGIGAGPECDGQVLVLHDLLGLFEDVRPKFVKHYAEMGKELRQAIQDYCGDVREGKFPGPEHEFK
jgi:3-methyl-2-oxobutanoate hydroxymethyltransferase